MDHACEYVCEACVQFCVSTMCKFGFELEFKLGLKLDFEFFGFHMLELLKMMSMVRGEEEECGRRHS